MKQIELLIKEAEDMIMNHQAENGFKTIFDQLNWTLGGIRNEVKKLMLTDVVGRSEQLICQHPYNKVEQNDNGEIICKVCNEHLAD